MTPESSLQSANNGLPGTSLGDLTDLGSDSIEELKQVTKLRLMAVTYARSKVRQYCVKTGRIISGQERDTRLMIAKMQFYQDSGHPVLVAEAQAWAAANPECLLFTSE